MKGIMYTKHLFCRKWNTFSIESFPLFSLHKCKHPSQRMPLPHRMNTLVGECELLGVYSAHRRAELFYGK